MLRRLITFFITLLTVLLDTSVIPVFYRGAYAVPLTAIVVLCIGLLQGQLYGILFGMIGGLLMDISTGTLGMLTFCYMAFGFAIALLVNEATDQHYSDVRFHLRRGLVSFGLYLVSELIFCFYRYFLTASFEWHTVLLMLLRSLMAGGGVMLLCPLLSRILFGRKGSQRRQSGKKREVKHF